MKQPVLSLLFVPFVLAACGGGGGGGGGAPAATASLTPANAQGVSQLAIDKSLGLVSVTSTGTGVLGSRLDGSQRPRGLDLKGFVRHRVQQLIAAPVLPVILTETTPGAQGGSAIATWNDADDNNVISTGDTFSIEFLMFEEDGVTLNGTLGIDQLVAIGDVETDPTWRLGARFVFDDLSGSEAGEMLTLDGALAIDVEQTLAKLRVALQLQASLTDGTATLFGGNTLVYEEDNAGAFTLNSSGALGDSTLDGVVTFVTPTPFGGVATDEFPSSGQLLITGAGGARIVVTVLDNTSLQIEVDTNGDGVAEDQRTVLWVDL